MHQPLNFKRTFPQNAVQMGTLFFGKAKVSENG